MFTNTKIVVFFIFWSYVGFGQNYLDYYNLANEAEFQFDSNNLTEAKLLFKNLGKTIFQVKAKGLFLFGNYNRKLNEKTVFYTPVYFY